MPNKSLHCTTNHDYHRQSCVHPAIIHQNQTTSNNERKAARVKWRRRRLVWACHPPLDISTTSRFSGGVTRLLFPSLTSSAMYAFITTMERSGKNMVMRAACFYSRGVCQCHLSFFFCLFFWLWLMRTQKGRLPAIWILRPQSHGHGRLYPTHLPRRRYLRTW